MKQWSKRIVVMAVAGILTATALTGCGSLDGDKTVATVGEDKVSLGVANFYARMQQSQYETYYAAMMGMTAEDLWKQEVEDGVSYEDSVKESTMKSIQDLYLMKQHMADYDITLSDEEQKAIEKAAKNFDDNNALEVKETITGYQKHVEELLELMTIQNKMSEAMRNDNVNTEVSDEEAAQKSMKYVSFSYTQQDAEGHSVEMTEEEKASLKEKAQSFAAELAAGTAIETVAETYADQGISVQEAAFDSESTSPAAELIKAVDALTTEGASTEVVETENGLYVAQLVSLFDEEATQKKKDSIVEERRNERYNELLDEWREATEISVEEKVWDDVDFEKMGVTIKDTTVSEEEKDATDEKTENEASKDQTSEDTETKTEE